MWVFDKDNQKMGVVYADNQENVFFTKTMRKLGVFVMKTIKVTKFKKKMVYFLNHLFS